MGSKCCRDTSIHQKEIVTDQPDAAATPVPEQKASLSAQGSKKSQVEEQQVQVQLQKGEYAVESEIQQEPEQKAEQQIAPVKAEETDQKQEIVQSQKMTNEQVKNEVMHKSLGGQNNSVVKLKIGHDIFVKLKDGSIGASYNFGKVLGQGAFGKVWKVTHKTTGLIRAIKQIKKSSIIKEEEQRLFSEMNILRNLDHPHIVKLFELFQDENNYYLVTEYLQGGELFDRIKKMSQFSESKAADYIRQILLATAHCHEQNIVHRDLKPENVIFVTEDPQSDLKVIDFGTSRKFDQKKAMSKRLGTPYYIAPEVLGHSYSEKCDIWSCGVILYILLCGYPPFVGKTENQILERVKLGKFTFDPEDWDQISKEAKDFIVKLLRMDPSQRLSAKQALEDPWLVKYAPSAQINRKVLDNIRQFQAQTILKQALLSYMITQMSTQKEIQELQREFKRLDENNDGFLSKEELLKGYLELQVENKLAEDEVERILETIDINRSGKIDFSEFCMAAMNQEKLLSVQRVEQAFKIFDQVNSLLCRMVMVSYPNKNQNQSWEIQEMMFGIKFQQIATTTVMDKSLMRNLSKCQKIKNFEYIIIMQQTTVSIDPSVLSYKYQVCHARTQSDKTLCGLAYFDELSQQRSIVQESLQYFRIMTFFKNYNYEGPSDILLIYLWIVTAYMIKVIENEQNQQAAAKKLDEIAREAIVTRNGDRKNFLGGLLKEIPGETEKIQGYLKGLKDILAKEIILIFFKDGKKTFDAKFWQGIAKRKFMGLSYTGL